MARTVFALALIQTSQGWVEPACPLPANDIPADELEQLHADGKVAWAEHDSPLAQRAHEIRRSNDRTGAPTLMQDAARTLSGDSPESTPPPMADNEHAEPTADDNSPQTTATPTADPRPKADPAKRRSTSTNE